VRRIGTVGLAMALMPLLTPAEARETVVEPSPPKPPKAFPNTVTRQQRRAAERQAKKRNGA
jgi:hypothetical protein